MKLFYSLSVKIIFSLFFFLFSFDVYSLQMPYAVFPENPRPGEPVTVGLRTASGAKNAVLVSDGKRLTRAVFFDIHAEDEKTPLVAAVFAVPSTAKPGSAVIIVECSRGILGEISIEIAERDFESEIIDLNPSLSSLRADYDSKKTAEANYLWSILNHNGKDAYYYGYFIPPVNSTRRTSAFGGRRVYRYSNGTSDVSIHAGIDYGVPRGTEVIACGAGKVVLARFRIVTGNSVIIEHLPGFYSLYYHLDSIDVSEGAVIHTGTRLGLSGATGLATGPHLHWEIRVFGENCDPDAFLAGPILDKDAILSRICP